MNAAPKNGRGREDNVREASRFAQSTARLDGWYTGDERLRRGLRQRSVWRVCRLMGLAMKIDDNCSETISPARWKALHSVLDNAPLAATLDERSQIGRWRASALSAEGRHEEAIDALRGIQSECRCRATVSKHIAENLRRLGRDMEAIEELKNAPSGRRKGSAFSGLVLDAKYVLAHLLASTRLGGRQGNPRRYSRQAMLYHRSRTNLRSRSGGYDLRQEEKLNFSKSAFGKRLRFSSAR